MTTSSTTEAQIAAHALTLREVDRDAYLRKRCGSDQALQSRVHALMVELEKADHRDAALLETVDPLASIGSVDETSDPEATCNFAEVPPAGELEATGEFQAPFPTTGVPETTPNQTTSPDDLADYDPNATISPGFSKAVQDLCESFRNAWESGQEPQLAEYLPREGRRDELEHLVYRLVSLDVQQRQIRGRPLSGQKYLEHFPEFRSAVHSALKRQASESDPAGSAECPTLAHGGSGTVGAESQLVLNKGSRPGTLRYQPVTMHAKGGLGAVYRANDTELSRTVALKTILPAHSDNPNSRSRFVFEAEVTGSLEHPGIVPVYGLGKTGDGQPYYAMRFIRGESFKEAISRFHQSGNRDAQGPPQAPTRKATPRRTKKFTQTKSEEQKGHATKKNESLETAGEHAKSAAPSSNASQTNGKSSSVHLDFYGREFRQLLRRMIDTCNAMQYAHERGVLHRDLKPDNVMLGQYGETLVVDWGLAKVKSQGSPEPITESSETDTLTVTDSGLRTTIGQAIGTPMYMSSEQAMGLHDDLTAASDVYSLGAMLFNIVTGQHPIEGKTARDIILNVREGRTKNLLETQPSAPKPLSSIIQKAMATKPVDRYQSASALAEDLDRWMSDEPVLAHKDHETLVEKAGRLIRRYRGWTVSGAAALFSIAVVSVVAALLINRAKQNEELAKLRATQFKGEAVQRYQDSRKAIDTWLVQSNDVLQFFPGTQGVRQRLLTIAAEDYAKLAGSPSADPDLELERGRTLTRLGDLSQLQEDAAAAKRYYTDAIEVLDQAWRDVRLADATIEHIDQLYVAEIGNAKGRLAITFANANQVAEAEKHYEEATTTLEALRQKSSNPVVLRYLATVMVNHGELDASLNRFDDARRRFESGLKLFAEIAQDALPNDVLFIARTRELLGRLARQAGDDEAALEHLQSAIEQLKPLVAANANHPEYLDALASAHISMASLERSGGQIDGGRRSLTQAVEHYRALVRAMPDVPRYEENLSASLIDLGLLLFELDRCRDAEPVLVEACGVMADLLQRYGNQSYYQSQFATAQDALGQVLWELGKADLSQQSLVRSLRTYAELNQRSPQIAEYVERLAIVQSHLARTATGADADAGFTSAAEMLTGLVEEFPDVPSYAAALGHVYYQQGMKRTAEDSDTAAAAFKRALETWTSIGTQRDAATSERLAWLLATCPAAELRDTEKAVGIAKEALRTSPENPRFQSTFLLALTLDGQTAELEKRPSEASGGLEALDGRGLLTKAIAAAESGDRTLAEQQLAKARKWMDDQAPRSQDLLRLLEIASP